MEGFLSQGKFFGAEAQMCHLWGQIQGDGSCPPLPPSLRWLWSALTTPGGIELWEAGWSGAVGGQAIHGRKWCFYAGPRVLLQSRGVWHWSAGWNRGKDFIIIALAMQPCNWSLLPWNCLMATYSHPVLCYHPSAPELWMEKKAAPTL